MIQSWALIGQWTPPGVRLLHGDGAGQVGLGHEAGDLSTGHLAPDMAAVFGDVWSGEYNTK